MSTAWDVRLAATEATIGLRPPIRNAVTVLADTFINAGLSPNMSREDAVSAISETSGVVFPTDSLVEYDFSLATGTGKTRLAIAIIEFLVTTQQAHTFVVLVHRELLKKRWIAEFDQEIRVRIGGNREVLVVHAASDLVHRPVSTNSVLIVVQTLQAVTSQERNWSLSLFSNISLDKEIRDRGDAVVFVDESHHVRSGDSQSVWMSSVETLSPRMLFGLTATPNRSRPVIFEYGLRDLLYEGKYSKDLEFVYETIHGSESDIESLALSRSLGEVRRKQEELVRLPETHPLRLVDFKPRLLVTVSTVLEVESTANKLIREFGLSERQVLRVSSRNSSDALLRLLIDLDQNDEVEVVVAAYMLDEGWDVTSISVICPLRALNSPANARQVVGRGLRLPLGRRSGIEAIDTLTVVSIGQESLAMVRKEVSDEFGARVQVHGPGGPGGKPSGDDEGVGPIECLITLDRQMCPDVAELTPSSVVFDHDAEIKELSSTNRKIAVIDASSGEVTSRVDSKVMRRQFDNGVQEILEVSRLSSASEVTHILMKAGFSVAPDLQLESVEVQRVRDELNRISAFEFCSLDDSRLTFPETVVTRSQYSLANAIDQSRGWQDKPGQWYHGFVKSVSDYCKFDSAPEFSTAQILDGLSIVNSWARNDPKLVRIECPSRTYAPDFIVNTRDVTILLEVKGRHLLPVLQTEVGVLRSVENWCTAQTARGKRKFEYRVVESDDLESALISLF